VRGAYAPQFKPPNPSRQVSATTTLYTDAIFKMQVSFEKIQYFLIAHIYADMASI
jgi:hypothetical protein